MVQLSSECINRNLLFDSQKGTMVPPVVGSRHCEMIFIESVLDSIREGIPGSGENSFLSCHQGVWLSVGFVCSPSARLSQRHSASERVQEYKHPTSRLTGPRPSC